MFFVDAKAIHRLIISITITVIVICFAVSPSFSATYQEDAFVRDQWISKAKTVSLSNINEYENRANSGDVESQMILTYALTDISGTQKDPVKAFRYLMMAASKGSPFAQAFIIYFVNAFSVANVSSEYAFNMALVSAKSSNVFGVFNAGSAYLSGIGTNQDLGKAYGLMMNAFDLGHPDAISRLCILRKLFFDRGDAEFVHKLDVHRESFKYFCGADNYKTKDELIVGMKPLVLAKTTNIEKGTSAEELKSENLPFNKEIVSAKLSSDKGEQERLVKIEQERLAKIEQERLVKIEQERLVKIEQERLAKIEQERLAKIEQERLAKIEQERLAKIEQKRLAKIEQERLAKIEQERLARIEQEGPGRIEREGLSRMELERLARIEQERLAKMEREGLARMERAAIVSGKNMPLIGQALPDITAISNSAQQFYSKHYNGNVLVLDFFAPWCQICRKQIPTLNELNDKYEKQGLQVVGLNVDSMGTSIYSSENGITYPIFQVDGSTQQNIGIRSVPVIFVVDADGKVAGVFHHYNSNIRSKVEALVKKLLIEANKYN